RLDAGARHEHVDDAVMHDRRRLLGAGWQPARPGHAQLRDVALVDLIERAIAVLVECAVDHQPVAGFGIGEHRIGHRPELRHLRHQGWAEGRRREHAEKRGRSIVSSPDHGFPPFCFLRLTVTPTCAGDNPSENFSKSPPDWQARRGIECLTSAAPALAPNRSAPAPIVVLLAPLPFGFTLLLLLSALPEQLDILDA